MTQTTPPPGPPGPAPQQQPRTGDAFFDSIRRSGLVRAQQRWVGGVAGGLAQRLGVDPLVVRGLFAVSFVLGGLGLILYGVGWLLLPEESDGRIHVQQLFHGDFDIAVLGGFAVLVSGLSAPDRWVPGLWWGGDNGWWSGLVGLALAVGIVVLVVTAARDRDRGRGGPGPTTTLHPTPPPYAAGPAPAPAPEGQTMPTTVPDDTQPAGGAGAVPPAPPVPPAPSAGWSSGLPTATLPVTPSGPAGPPPAWSGGPAWQGPPSGPRPPQLPVTSLPRRRPQGAGPGLLGSVVALTLMTLAGLLYTSREGLFDGPVALTTLAVGVTLCGLAVIVAGLRGRTAGGIAGLAVLGILAAAPLAAVDRADVDADWSTGMAVGEIDATPTDVATAERGWSMGAGDAVVDLTELPLDGDAVVVPIHLGAGDLTVVMPEGGAYEAEIQVMAGEIRWLDDTVRSGVGNVGRDTTFESDAVESGAEPDILLEITLGAGNVQVEES